MTEKGYMSDVYKQLEEVMNKCDSLSQQIKTIRKNVTLELNARFDIERTNYENRIKDLENGANKDYSLQKFPYPILNNCLPQIDVFLDNGYTKEEMRLIA